MKQYTLADLKEESPLRPIVDAIFATWDAERPLKDQLENLYRENVRLLGEIIALEKEMKTKPSLRELFKTHLKIYPLRSKINKNDEEVRKILGRLLRSR